MTEANDDAQVAAEVVEAMRELTRVLASEFPEVQQLLDDATAGRRDEGEVMMGMLALKDRHPNFEARFMALSHEILGTLRDEGEEMVPVDPDHPLAFDSGVGAPQLNPLYSAAIAERLQFDGDVPEHRVGPAPPDVVPAVPVLTTAKSLVAVGGMLKTASVEMRVELDVSRRLLQERVEQEPSGDTALAVVEEQDAALVLHGSAETDPEGYKRGQLPVPRGVKGPSGAALAVLGVGERQDAAWKALSTTQGRRSVAQTITDAVAVFLNSHGFDVAGRKFRKDSKPEVGVEWTVNLDGPKSLTSDFAFVETASAVIAKKLSGCIEPGCFWVEVRTVDTVSTRKVGWYGQLVPRG
jgi:hypothetical protein